MDINEKDTKEGNGQERYFKAVPDDISSQERSKTYWESWLPQALGMRLDKIKNLVEVQYKQHEKYVSMKWYTPHDIDHCRAVEDYIHRLIPDQHYRSLSEYERFFLLASAWLHDIGMMPVFEEDADRMSEKQIRAEHHLRTERYINEHFAELGLLECEANILGILARYHRRRENIEKCKDRIAFPEGVIRLRLLASYLRLADALHTDQTRAPIEKFAIALTYNIPYDAKLHWLKSKFIIGIDVNPGTHAIVVHVKRPSNLKSHILVKSRRREIESKIHSILKDNIIRDLQDELDSISKVLIDEGITYYLRVTHQEHEVHFEKALLKDVCTALDERILLHHPSSSSLYNIVSQTFLEVLNEKRDPKSCIDNARVFLQNVRMNVAANRSTHYGLLKILKDASSYLENSCSRSVDDFECSKETLIKQFESINSEIVLNRSKVRRNSKRYFFKYLIPKLRAEYFDLDACVSSVIQNVVLKSDTYCSHDEDWAEKSISKARECVKRPLRVLLYGNSEYVLRALCGFRDGLIEYVSRQLYMLDADWGDENAFFERLSVVEHYKLIFEKMLSVFFEIFVCEGQPKNQTGDYGRITYHDGWQYSTALSKRNFQAVYMIPDAVVGQLIPGGLPRSGTPDNPVGGTCRALDVPETPGYPQIDLVLVGTNGYRGDKFYHTAGHSTVVKLCAERLIKNGTESNTPGLIDVVMVATTMKHLTQKQWEEIAKSCGLIDGNGKESESCGAATPEECKLAGEDDKQTAGKTTGAGKSKVSEQKSDGKGKRVEEKWKIGCVQNKQFTYKGPFGSEHVRDNIFFPQDDAYFSSLFGSDSRPLVYVPREDVIDFSSISGVITEEHFTRLYDLEKKPGQCYADCFAPIVKDEDAE
jgi:hypothetical protein